MVKWKIDQKKIFIKLFYADRRRCITIIPKPTIENLESLEGIIFETEKNNNMFVTGRNSQ